MRMSWGSSSAKIITRLITFFILMLVANGVQAVPYHGESFLYHQPDGSIFEIRLYGDEFYAVAETIDGYTIVRDPLSGMFCYANLSLDENSLESTGVVVGEGSVPPSNLQKGIRISRSSMNRKSRVAREQYGVDERGLLLPELRSLLRPEISPRDGIQSAPPSSETTGTRVGLVLLAQFPDHLGDATISRSEIDAYANDPNYTDFGNATSVYGYFNIQSDGRLQYNCIVTAYFTATQNRDYYTDTSIAFGTRAKELINEGLSVLKALDYDFTKNDGNNDSVLDGVNIFYAGTRVNGWSEGLWPHKWSSSWAGLAGEGVSTSFQYQITDIGNSLSLGTFCHENGHMICSFPDLYSYSGNAAEIGAYSLMSQSGTTHPRHVDAYLKMHAGWADIIDITSASHLRGSVQVDKNRFYRYQNPSESREYFLISIRGEFGYEGIYGGAAATNPTDGLVIWHAREHGSNTYSSIFTAGNPSADYSTPYELMLVEASPSSATTPWYDDPSPGTNDAYHSGGISAASDSTTPALKFWNTATGRTTASNLNIHSIGAQGDTITFTIGDGAVTGVPVIGTTTSTLSPTCDYGTDASSQSFAVFNQGGGTLSYSLSESISWLSLDVTSGTATTESDIVTLSYDTTTLVSDTYSGTITITDSGATNSPRTVTVNLTVYNQPTIYLDTTMLFKTVTAGDIGSDTIKISNSGGGTLFYTLAASTSWLNLSTTSGTAAAEEDEVDLIFDATTLLNGIYYSSITVSSGNATLPSETTNVVLTVTGSTESVIVITPAGGETFWQGNNYNVEWSTDGTVAGNVRIDLYKSGVLDSTIAANTINDGQYTWSVPGGQAIGADYKVRISSVEDGTIYGDSSSNISIVAMPTLVSIPYSESFESGLGDWVQSVDEDFDWKQDSSGTPSSGTGPSAAQNGSFYIYTESSSPNYPSKVAKIEAYFDLRSVAAPQMSFYYHMYGATMGTLAIRVSADQENWSTIFTKTGNQGEYWRQATVNLSDFAGQVVVAQVAGTTGNGWSSDMALDAFTISASDKILTYNLKVFTEDVTNDGSISNNITMTLAGDTFTSTAVSNGYISAENVPTGLTAQFVRNSSTQITMSLTGKALAHTNVNDISDLKVRIADGAFTAGDASVVAGNGGDLLVDYINNGTIYTVNASVDGNGTLNSSSQIVNHGSAASFTVTPNTGYFTDAAVGGNCPAGTWTNTSYTTGAATGACNVSFTHTLKSYTVTSSVIMGNGTIDPAAVQVVNHGAVKQFDLNPANGYQVNMVSGSCGGILLANIYTTNAVISDCTVVASFSEQLSDQYSLSVVIGGNGSGAVTSDPVGINCGADCDEMYNGSTSVTLLAIPETGSKFIGWSGDADCKDGFITMANDVSCIANFYSFPWDIFMPAITSNGRSLP